MSYYRDNVANRIMECLGMPLPQRCAELQLLFDHSSLRELQDVFPAIVQSVFGIGTGGLGWGLRTMTLENAPEVYDILRDFFSPLGPMFRLCYRLLADSIKFEFSLDVLPYKVVDMLRSGQYSMFYADLVNVDAFRRQVTSLLLNPFDYYILHFVIHATFPLHKMYPAALQVHNELLKTIYFFLTFDYLNMFLPGSPDGVVLPTNISTTVKAPQPMPVQPLQAPKRSSKYLKIPTTSLYAGTSPTISPAMQNARNAESPRAHAWRTESVIHFFIDVWLRYDIDEMRDLPSSEFIRVVRTLVKQTHTFATSAYMDQSIMASLRKAAQSMMKAQIYSFLKSVISRWPLDNSLSVVLELWLTYIQPWRYGYEWPNRLNVANIDIPISDRFDSFIADNIVVFTQIFVLILRRFVRLDFSTLKNVIMLNRLVKVFSQTTLPKKLYQIEQSFTGNPLDYDSPQRRSHQHTSRQQNTSGGNCEWDTLYHDENYVPLFGVQVQKEIEQFIKAIYISRVYVQHEISTMQRDILVKQKSLGVIKRILSKCFRDTSPTEVKLQDLETIPDMLDAAIRTLGAMFNVDMPNISIEQMEPREHTYSNVNFSMHDNSDYLDFTRLSPMQMQVNVANFKNMIDPALLPIESHECKILVRFLHQVSCKLNEMFGEDMQTYYRCPDFKGKLARLLLYPPMVAKWFDKSRGVSELCENHLPARVCLRPLASYKVLGALSVSLVLGHLLWHAPSYGLLVLFLLTVVYHIILAFIT